jgi:tripartite-type tricarboxylate transporter receptor subunit TctC
MMPKLPYDPIRDFAPVVLAGQNTLLVVVTPSMPVKSVKDLIALGKARPGQLNYGSSGTGTPAQLAGVMFSDAAGVKMVHVPYKGSAPALSALIGGETQLMFASLGSSLNFIKGGRLRPLAVTSAKRSAAIPEMPTIEESGFPGFEAITWHGLMVPAGTPAPIVQRLNAETVKILRQPEFVAWLLSQGADATPCTPDEFTAFLKSELALYARLVRQSGMKPD